MAENLERLKQRIPLLEYLQRHNWKPCRAGSFLVDTSKNLFYCYGCNLGGDVIRFAELYHHVRFPQASALFQQWRGLTEADDQDPVSLRHEFAGLYE